MGRPRKKPKSWLPTASALERVLACPASHVLPHEQTTSEYAEAGRAVHKYLEAVALVGKETALEHVPEYDRELCEAIPLERLPVHLAPEVALAYDVVTGRGRRLPRGDGYRDYESATENEIAMTVDALGVNAESVYIGDYKTGKAVTRARENPQLLVAALAAMDAYGVPSARVEVIYVRPGHEPWIDSATVSEFDLIPFANRLSDLRSMLNQMSLVPNLLDDMVSTGPHCRYCPAFSACPKQQELAESMTDGSMLQTVNGWVGLITRDNAVDAYRKLQQMKRLVKRCSDIIAAYTLENGPIDIGDGLVFGPRMKLGNETLDGPTVAKVVAEKYGPVAAMACIEPKATKKSIERGVVDAGLPDTTGKTKAALSEEILGAVREAGGASRKTSQKIDEHKGG